MTRQELLNSADYWQGIAENQCYRENIDYTLQLVDKKQMIDKACKIYCDDICDISRCGMCYHKYDHKAQVKNDFKYSECETLKMFRKDMEEE